MLPKPPECSGCPLHADPFGKPEGWVPAHGSGENGVLVVLEAPGKDEEKKGIPTVGKAGYALWSKVLRATNEAREGFRVHSALSCRPPEDRLAGAPYEHAALANCATNLDRTIKEHKEASLKRGRTPVILTLGGIAFQQVMGWGKGDRRLDLSYYNYPHWSERRACWVVASAKPGYFVRGNQAQTPMLTYAFEQALRIALHPSYEAEAPKHLCDPSPATALRWAQGYIAAHQRNPKVVLAYDIETPFKKGSDEEEVSREDDSDYTILRCGYAYGAPGDTPQVISFPWTAPYLAAHSIIYAHQGEDGEAQKVGWNSDNYDNPRIAKHLPMKGTYLDGMLAWHVLESSLRKGLGVVVPFYCPDHPFWKSWSGNQPALYNACDADVTLRCWHGIYADLRKGDLWSVFERHVYKIQFVLGHMRDKGVPFDMAARGRAERKVAALLEESDSNIQAAVPMGARATKVYKKLPKEPIEGLQEVPARVEGKVCPACAAEGVKAAHFKSIGKKRLKKGERENPCHGWKAVKRLIDGKEWHLPLDFKVSATSLKRYQAYLGHKPVFHRREKNPDGSRKVTFDATAIQTLERRYPEDPLYKEIATFSKRRKLLGTYIGRTNPLTGVIKGGMPVEADGRVHTQITSTPSTLRFASQNPNLQNLPRPNARDEDDIANLIRGMIVAGKGNLLGASDFCVVPRTRILKSDLSWAEARDLEVGDELIGFDEDFSPLKGLGKGHRRYSCFRRSVVKAKRLIRRPLVRVYTDRGMTTVSAEHRFVARSRSYPRKWVEAQNLKPGMLMPFLSAPWEREVSYDAGWLAGYLDGEGWVSNRGGVGHGQLPGSVLAKAQRLFAERGYEFRNQTCTTTAQCEHLGGMGSALRLLGSIRPVRLLEKAPMIWEGRTISSKTSKPATVLAVEPMPEGEVIALETSTGTFISDGFFSHNCGIEAVLVGWEAGDPNYVRLARRDVHSFYTAHAIHMLEPERLSANDLPLLSWDDEKLFTRLGEIKRSFKWDRNNLYKHLVHAINFGQKPPGAQQTIYKATGVNHDVHTLRKLMALYGEELFPSIPKWQEETRRRADKDGFLRNAFGYVHHFFGVFERKRHWVGDKARTKGEWIVNCRPGPDASAVLAFGPQSNAAAILKEAMLRIHFERWEEAGQYLRLPIHDELFYEAPEGVMPQVIQVFEEEMGKPIPELNMPDHWGLGPQLSILVESKSGRRWSSMD